MKYLQGKFSVAVGSKEYRDGWDAIFGKKEEPEEPKEDPTLGNHPLDLQLLEKLDKEVEDALRDARERQEPFVPAGHRKLPGGGIRGPRKV